MCTFLIANCDKNRSFVLISLVKSRQMSKITVLWAKELLATSQRGVQCIKKIELDKWGTKEEEESST